MAQKKQRSLLQEAQSTGNLVTRNLSRKENVPPSDYLVPASALITAEEHIKHEHERGDSYKRRMNNEHRKGLRAKAQNEKVKSSLTSTKAELRTIKAECNETHAELKDTHEELNQVIERNQELKKNKDAFRKHKARAPARITLAANKGAKKAGTVHMREHGAISESCREMVRELVKCGVPVDNVNDVIHIVCEGFGFEVPDGISPRSVSRIVLEGGIAAKMQLAHRILTAQCM